ncbi:glycerophosphoryl diester phosphodiesterase [Methylocella silvestris BL2]|uniref:glycerophosphodiester phosphodiesterase n=1 Tax=Methylocella silvestris (strain DSM 15510 / CIP 108128 / LMG 27833 / NCIMB 13906 / BL2) TaxID=395965 RepID=B8EQ53_METSB|nr:glycerophosphodiester phosphodiesterase family protein [Methylocella silvestris]ACK51543.1 glycerophosphoryl diester phosphodiesterase [Methylocella silvestris BL2]
MMLKRQRQLLATALLAALALPMGDAAAFDELVESNSAGFSKPLNVQVGPRPYYLVDQLQNGPLKSKLKACSEKHLTRTRFSISHRGAPMQFPEHTVEGYQAAARMGAGIIECDVTFTKDRELVCRHDQCDLHTTTNILTIPALAAKCTQPFTPANGGTPASATCCTSDITLAEFRLLKGKMDGFNPNATTPEEYQNGTPSWRTEAYSATGTLVTLKEHIALMNSFGVNMTPELKEARVPMPYQGDFTQEKYAQKMIDAYKAAGVSPKRVWAQSFNINDIYYWIKNEPAFGKQAVALAETDVPADLPPAIAALPGMRAKGVQIVAPPIWALIALDGSGKIVPSAYANAIKQNGFKIIPWSLERSGPLTDGGGYYYQSVSSVIKGPGDYYNVLDVLSSKVGILGIFSDWPGTATYYGNCFNKP